MFGFYCTNNLCTIHVHNHTTTKSYTCMRLSHTQLPKQLSLSHTHTGTCMAYVCVCEYSTQFKNILKKLSNLSSLSVCHSVHVLDSSSCKGHHGSYTLFPLAQCLHSGLSWSHLLAAMKHRESRLGRERESPVCWQF